MSLLDFAVGLLLLPAAFFDFLSQGSVDFPMSNTTINGGEFSLYRANSSEQWQQGFKGRLVQENEAMIFEFPKDGTRMFWMRGTKTPLDIVFLDENMRVTRIHHGARPCTLMCRPYFGKGKYVLEFKAGIAKKIGINPNEPVKMQKL